MTRVELLQWAKRFNPYSDDEFASVIDTILREGYMTEVELGGCLVGHDPLSLRLWRTGRSIPTPMQIKIILDRIIEKLEQKEAPTDAKGNPYTKGFFG